MKKFLKKSISVFLVLSSFIPLNIPIYAQNQDGVLLSGDFDNGVPSLISWETGGAYRGYYETLTDENNNKYGRIRAQYNQDGRSWIADGFSFSSPMTDGEYDIHFDFSVEQGSGYEMIALCDDEAGKFVSSWTSEFRLGDWSANKFRVNKKALTGSITSWSLGHWYTYDMKIDKTQGTYTVKVSDKSDPSLFSTGSGSGLTSNSFKGLTIGAGATVLIDNIRISRPAPNISGINFYSSEKTLMNEPDASAGYIKIDFDSEMDPQSFSEDNISFSDTDGNQIPLSFEISSDNKGVFIHFEESLKENEEYGLYLGTGVCSFIGVGLNESIREAFFIKSDTTLLLVDYDDNTRSLDRLESTSPVYQIIENGQGGNYLDIDAKWTNWGYKLQNPITKNSGEYNVEFDFSLTDAARSQYYLALSEKATETGDNVYHQFGLLRIAPDGNFLIAGRKTSGMLYESDTWYRYRLTFNRKTRYIDVCIAKRDDPECKAVYKGYTPIYGSYGNSIPDRLYDKFRIGYSGLISLDNIYIGKNDKKPVELSLSSPYAGNIFGGDEDKSFSLGIKNLLNKEVFSDISYKVYDEDDALVDSGRIYNVLSSRENRSEEFTVNISKYGVYYIVFDINAKPDGENESIYKSARYMFSSVNKKDPDAPLNPQIAANIPYIYNNTQWQNFKEVLLWAGISSVRKDLLWYDVEKTKGQYTKPETTGHFDDLLLSGMENMVILNATCYAYSENGKTAVRPDTVGTDEIWSAWENYVDWVSDNYKDQIEYYEIINESSEYLPVDTYCRYLKKAYRIIKQNDPDAKVVGIVSASLPKWWIGGCLDIIAEDSERYIDIVSVHPYDFNTGELQTTVPGLEWSIVIRDDIYKDKIEWTKNALSERGLGGIPVYSTEMAITSTKPVSLHRQACELAQLYALDYAGFGSDKTYWYCFENTDIRGDNDEVKANTEANFGLVGNYNDVVPLAAKPSYVALAGFNKMLTGAEYIDGIDKPDLKALRFEHADGKQTVVVWSEGDGGNISLDLGADSAELYDIYSNRIGTLYAQGNKFDLTAGAEPIYLTGNFTKISETAGNCMVDKGIVNASLYNKKTIIFTDQLKRDLDISISSSPSLSAGVNKTQNGQYDISVTPVSGAGAEERIEIKAYSGNEMIYYSRVYVAVESIEPARVKVNGSEITSLSGLNGDDQILLDIDFDNNIPSLEKFEGTAPVSEILSEGNSNSYLHITSQWGNWGYMLSEAIPTDGGDYALSFDFSLPAPANNYIVCLNQADDIKGDNVYHQFGLLRTRDTDNDGTYEFQAAGRTIDGISFSPGVWYTYDLSFNRSSGDYKLKISERDNKTQYACSEGVFPDDIYGNGLLRSKTYDSFKFYYNNTVDIDNILLRKTYNAVIEINTENLSEDERTVKLYTAYYGKSEKLLKATERDITLSLRGVNREDVSLDLPPGCKHIKFMIWNGEKMIPTGAYLKYSGN